MNYIQRLLLTLFVYASTILPVTAFLMSLLVTMQQFLLVMNLLLLPEPKDFAILLSLFIKAGPMVRQKVQTKLPNDC